MKRRFWLRQNPSQSDTCASLEPLLSLLSDGMASPAEVRRVESHLSTCEDCRRALGWMQATHLIISERPAALPPVNLRARIARAIADAEPAPLSVRTARPPMILRPARFAAAASLAAALIVAGHSLLTTTRPAAPPLTTVAQAPPPHSASPAVPTPPFRALPMKTARVATAPRRSPAAIRDRLPVAPHSDAVQVARVIDAPVHGTPLVSVLPRVTGGRTPVRVVPRVKPPLIAMKPAAKPHGIPHSSSPADRVTLEAKNFPDKPLHEKSSDVLTTSPELAAPAPVAIEATQPKAVQVAVAVPASTVEHKYYLNAVVARLATFRAASPALKVYRDSNVHVQTAAYEDESKFVQAPVTYTPTHLADAK